MVAGVQLGKEVGKLHHLTQERLFDYCLMIGASIGVLLLFCVEEEACAFTWTFA